MSVKQASDVLFMKEMNEWSSRHSNLSILPRLGEPFANFHCQEKEYDQFMDLDSIIDGVTGKLAEDLFQDFKIEKQREKSRTALTAMRPRNVNNLVNVSLFMDKKSQNRNYISPVKSSYNNDIMKRLYQTKNLKLRPAISKRTV